MQNGEDHDGDDGEDNGWRLIGEDDGYHGGEEGLTMEKTTKIGEDTNSALMNSCYSSMLLSNSSLAILSLTSFLMSALVILSWG
ncbi:hypothetical protein Tco_1127507 [Tanacetum coccineum]